MFYSSKIETKKVFFWPMGIYNSNWCALGNMFPLFPFSFFNCPGILFVEGGHQNDRLASVPPTLVKWPSLKGKKMGEKTHTQPHRRLYTLIPISNTYGLMAVKFSNESTFFIVSYISSAWERSVTRFGCGRQKCWAEQAAETSLWIGQNTRKRWNSCRLLIFFFFFNQK